MVKNVDELLDESISKPKDTFSSRLIQYMSDDEFPKAIMMHILRAKIALDFHQTEERNFGLEHEYSPTLNCTNSAMAGVNEIDCDPTDNLAVNDHMDLGEDYLFKVE